MIVFSTGSLYIGRCTYRKHVQWTAEVNLKLSRVSQNVNWTLTYAQTVRFQIRQLERIRRRSLNGGFGRSGDGGRRRRRWHASELWDVQGRGRPTSYEGSAGQSRRLLHQGLCITPTRQESFNARVLHLYVSVSVCMYNYSRICTDRGVSVKFSRSINYGWGEPFPPIGTEPVGLILDHLKYTLHCKFLSNNDNYTHTVWHGAAKIGKMTHRVE